MKVYITYLETKFKEEDFYYLRDDYDLSIRSFGLRHGAIDIITVLEFSFNILAGGLIYDYFKGLTGFNGAERLGKETREYITKFNKTIEKIYIEQCEDQLNLSKAVAYVEYFNFISIYAVLNHSKSNKELVCKLGEAFIKIY